MRLEISRRTGLALRALRHLDGAEGRVGRQALAEAAHTTPDFVARVIAPLVKAGWVRSDPGRGGGYEIAVDLDTVSTLDLIGLVDSIPDATTCVLRAGPCGIDESCELHDAWTAARSALLGELDRTPLGAGRRI